MIETVMNRWFRGNIARATGMAVSLCAALVLSGCGLGPGKETGEAGLLVTRDYGAKVLVDEPDLAINESSTAMRLLDQNAELKTEYGGGFVQSVDGLSGGIESGRSFDWFYSVNGIVAERGSAEFPVVAGDQVWWDYRDWTKAMNVGAVVGAYPAPFSTGYSDRDWGVEIDCRGDQVTCDAVAKKLEDDGVTLQPKDKNMILRIGRWDQMVGTPEGKRMSKGLGESGVFARFNAGLDGTPRGEASSPWRLIGLDIQGNDAVDYGPESGLVAAMRRGEAPPVWLLTGGTDEAVKMAAVALGQKYLERRYAAVVSDGEVSSLPQP